MFRPLSTGLLLGLPLASAEPVNFSLEVAPILAEHCYACHGPDDAAREADLRLDTREGATADLGGYAAIVAGDHGASEAILRIESSDPDEVMPPPKVPRRLSAEEKATLKRWIDEGAPWGKHWAYEPPQRSVPPTLDGELEDWVRNPIDRFVARRLAEEQLEPSPEARPEILARRIALDLTGLPPSPAQVDEFVAAHRADPDAAVAEWVDRLLASPHFGERWATPWLDAARYAESHGYQKDDLIDLWPYRDWVIDALNADMPFDRFTIEQLAGDLLPDPTPLQLIATGFHRAAPTNVEAGSDQEQTRTNQILDRVNTTGVVWMAQTLECAQCHNHKYDPISQREYFQLYDFFNQTVQETDFASKKATAALKFLGPYVTPEGEIVGNERPPKLLASGRVFLSWFREEPQRQPLPELGSAPSEHWFARVLEGRGDDWLEPEAAPDRSAPSLTGFKAKRDRAGRRNEFSADPRMRSLVMQQAGEPRESFIFNRGNFLDPGEPVSAATPEVLPPMDEELPRDRFGLAKWLVDRDHPLTARVTVNRWWATIFGRGLVGTVEDFGSKGELPSHPQLLDWLALEFMEPTAPDAAAWSMKHVLRLILNSATYRQSSDMPSFLREIDDRNLLLARGPRLRLHAEAIRDNALEIAGLLHPEVGGPPVFPPQPDGMWEKVGGLRYPYPTSEGADAHRRGLYIFLRRSAPYPSLVTFDATNRLACTVKRSRSNTPLQALTLLNDPVYVEAADALATRLRDHADDDRARLRHGFRLAVSRPPEPPELEVLENLLADSRDARAGQPQAERAAWRDLASTLLNLDETITKR